MKHKIFLVHGMGVYDTTWGQEVKSVLQTCYEQYPTLALEPFDDVFDVQAVLYDDVFQDIVGQWQQGAKGILDVAELNPGVVPDDVTRMVGWLDTAAETDGNFIWTHATDVLLYRLSALVRQRVKVTVAQQLVEAIDKQHDTDHRSQWSVIAHSLGTAVAHDALDMMFTGELPGEAGPTAFDPRLEQANVIAMVANTSRLLEVLVDVYKSTIMPGNAGDAGRGCLNYLNLRHYLDPFTIPRMFHPDDWPDAAAQAEGRYQHVELSHVHQFNVHDICHYLRNPEAHIPLFRMLLGPDLLPDAEAEPVRQNFPQLGGLAPERAATIKGKLASVTTSIGETWQGIPKIWDDFHALMAEEQS